MSGVDVLAVMTKSESLARRTCGLSGDPNARALLKGCAEARAAVAELIEAVNIAAYGEYLPPSVEQRIRTALARATGAQP